MRRKTDDTFYLARSAAPGPGVLVIHAWWGLNDFFKSVCDRLAEAGLVALAPDLYDGEIATTAEEAKRLRAAPKHDSVSKILKRGIGRLQNEALATGGVGVVGFSMGAHWAYWLSHQPDLPITATVAFYGVRDGDFTHSRSAFLTHLADQDEWVSAGAVQRVKKSLAAAGREATFYTYPGTGHWFFEQDRAGVYDAAAADLAWRRTVEFLQRRLA